MDNTHRNPCDPMLNTCFITQQDPSAQYRSYRISGNTGGPGSGIDSGEGNDGGGGGGNGQWQDPEKVGGFVEGVGFVGDGFEGDGC